MLIVPAGAAFASGALVGFGTAVGELALLPDDGAEVDAGVSPLVGVSPPVDGTGVAVAEDPQANNSATNNRTTALVRCLDTRALNADCGTYSPLLLRNTISDGQFSCNRFRPHFVDNDSIWMVYMPQDLFCQYCSSYNINKLFANCLYELKIVNRET